MVFLIISGFHRISNFINSHPRPLITTNCILYTLVTKTMNCIFFKTFDKLLFSKNLLKKNIKHDWRIMIKKTFLIIFSRNIFPLLIIPKRRSISTLILVHHSPTLRPILIIIDTFCLTFGRIILSY